jgi:hypothetical protein
VGGKRHQASLASSRRDLRLERGRRVGLGNEDHGCAASDEELKNALAGHYLS